MWLILLFLALIVLIIIIVTTDSGRYAGKDEKLDNLFYSIDEIQTKIKSSPQIIPRIIYQPKKDKYTAREYLISKHIQRMNPEWDYKLIHPQSFSIGVFIDWDAVVLYPLRELIGSKDTGWNYTTKFIVKSNGKSTNYPILKKDGLDTFLLPKAIPWGYISQEHLNLSFFRYPKFALIEQPIYFPSVISNEQTRCIIQTNKDVKIPVNMHLAAQHLRFLNPDWEYHYFDDSGAQDFILEHFNKSILEEYIISEHKEAIFGICAVLKMGGVFINSSCLDKVPLREFLDQDLTISKDWKLIYSPTPSDESLRRVLHILVSTHKLVLPLGANILNTDNQGIIYNSELIIYKEYQDYQMEIKEYHKN